MPVAAGDIAFVALSSDNTGEGFAFVALRPIAPGDSIRFIEGANPNADADSGLLWTNGSSTLAAGTVVQINFGAVGSAIATTPGVTGGGTVSTVTNYNTQNNSGSGATATTGGWNLSPSATTTNVTADNLYAVTGDRNAPGTYVAAVAFGSATTPTLTSGASLVNLSNGAATSDVNSINRTTSDASYANADAARTAYTNAGTSSTATGNWVRDDGINDGTGNNDAEWTALGDANSPLYQKTTLAVDNAAPTVSSVAYGANDGTLRAGEQVTFTVTFSEAVFVAGTPSLTLNTASTPAGSATYTSGSGSNALVFTYTAAAGQNTSDLAVTAFNVPTGASVRDGAGNAANTAGAVTNPASTLAVDTAAPTVTNVAYGTNDGALAAGEAVTFRLTFSENVAVTGTPTLTLNTAGGPAGTATYTSAGSSGNVLVFTYTPAAGQSADDLAVTAFNLNGGTVRDAAGNNANTAGAVTNPGDTLRVDTAAPTVSGVTYGTSDGALAAGEPVTFNVTFSENVTVTGQPTLSLGTTPNAGTATYTGGSGGNVLTFTYTPAAGQNADDLAVTAFNLNGGTVRDAAGNNANTAGAATNPAGTLAVDTAPDSNVAVDLTDASTTTNAASVAFNLSGLDTGSTATVTFAGSGANGGSTTATYTTNGAKTASVSGLQGDVTATVSVRDAAGNVAAGQGETLANDPVCFMAGTMVRTPSGEVPVEALKAGDPVLTHTGETAPVRWLGRQTVSTRFADPARVLPIRVAAGALGENLPTRDLLVSPDHALLVDGVLTQAGALVNGTTIRRERAVPKVFTYWHVELADHALVLAEGVPAETFIDNVVRLAFDNWDEHEAAGTGAPIAEMALPRAKSARQVPAATRRRLAERAAALTAAQRTAAA